MLNTPRKRQRNLSQGFSLFYPTAAIDIFINLIYLFTGWFAVTIEAFLRYDFGERYYSRSNAMIGLTMLTILTFFSDMSYSIVSIHLGDGWFHLLWWSFVLLSIMHFLKMWLNTQLGTPQHSLYSGRSRLQPAVIWLLRFLNPLLNNLAMLLGRIVLRGNQYDRFVKSLTLSPMIPDAEAFTKRMMEPLIVLCIAWYLTSGTLFFWLLICAFSLAMHSNIAYNEQHQQYLDMADGMIEALYQQQDMQQHQSRHHRLTGLTQQLKQRSQQDPQFLQELKTTSPSIAEAVEALNRQQSETL